MEVISSNAPYFLNVLARTDSGTEYGNYYIYLGQVSQSNLLYSGKVYAPDEGARVVIPVNIQPVLVNYTNSNVELLQNFNSGFQPSATQGYIGTKFSVVYDSYSATEGYVSLTVELFMVYCTENATNKELGFDSSTSTFPLLANDYIQGKYVLGTYFSLTRIVPDSGDGATMTLVQKNAQGDESSSVWNFGDGTYRGGGTLPISADTVSFSILVDNNPVITDMEVVSCLPANSYILYYVNSLGAIDYIICDKKNTVTYNADRHGMTRYATIANRTKFGKLNYLNNSTRTWELNTDIMSDQQSSQMYKVFNSQYMWLYDCDKNQINSVVLEDASLKIKKFDTDKVFNYTIKVSSSQTFTIQ